MQGLGGERPQSCSRSVSLQQPSIAKATNIDTLLGAKVPEEKIPEPPESVQDKIAFICNNLSLANVQPKVSLWEGCYCGGRWWTS